jgi:hypothetical protein
MHYLFLNYMHFTYDRDLLPMFQKLKDADEKLPVYMHTPLNVSLKGQLQLMDPD